MEDWAVRAIARWPDVPALFGWLGLNRRGRWLIRGETISRPQIIDTIGRNYAVDQHGRWYFQNGPQRGFVRLDYAPFVLSTAAGGEGLSTHCGDPVTRLLGAHLDEEGSVLLVTEHGAGLVIDTDLDWVLSHLHDARGGTPDLEQLAAALALPSGRSTSLCLRFGDSECVLQRLDADLAPAALGFVRDPQPRAGEKIASGTDVLLH